MLKKFTATVGLAFVTSHAFAFGPPLRSDVETSPIPESHEAQATSNPQPAAPADVQSAEQPSAQADIAQAPVGNLWDRIREGFAMPDVESSLVARHEAWFLNNPEYFQRMMERCRLYLYFIVQEVEKRGLPTEIALLPMIESAYNPNALSRAHASGIWQFIPSTGRRYGLQQNWWLDERRDVMAATEAALDYLQALYDEFGDWPLALAAYNWGENGVKRAIARNKASRKSIDYLSLQMPRETRNFVPKLQAMKNIIDNPSALSFAFPEVADRPYFTAVTTSQHMDVQLAAHLAEMSVEDFVLLNPAYNRPVITSDGARTLLLPIDKAGLFTTNLESYDAPLVSWQTYTLKHKETLESVAQRFSMESNRLREINGIKRFVDPRPGRTLLVPLADDTDESNLTDTWDDPQFQAPDDFYRTRIVHRVRQGDTLSTIARRYRVSIRALTEWNHIRGTFIRAGQKLMIYRDPRVPQVSKMVQ
ncbi:MAG: transglycosylase SLT domain-containing protein [Burkholderiales bacterium]